MICTRCGTYIEDGENVCYKCGFIFEDNSQSAFNQQQNYNQTNYNQQPDYGQQNFNQQKSYNQPQGGYNPQQYDPYAQGQGGYGYGYNEKAELSAFAKAAKSMQTTGIIATVLMFGIGFAFSIALWIQRSKVTVPQITSNDPADIAMFTKAKKQYDTAFILSFMPIIGFVIGFIIGFVGAL